MPHVPLAGRCLCGAVRYSCGPLLYPATLCHCESCRRAAGAHAVGWFTVAAGSLTYSAAMATEFASSPRVVRGFCARCGTSLTYRHHARAGEIDITIASLDRPAAIAPADHIFMEDALPWDTPGDGRPQFATTRSRG